MNFQGSASLNLILAKHWAWVVKKKEWFRLTMVSEESSRIIGKQTSSFYLRFGLCVATGEKDAAPA
jgi:hypothetical protein